MEQTRLVEASAIVTSADGARIAYTRKGKGAPLVLVAGILSDRRRLQGLVDALAQDFTVYNFDRRGRGKSTDMPPYSLAKETADIAAVIKEAGGTASLYGHSSGAGLALHAAAAGVPIDRLILHEPPYGGDDAASMEQSRSFAGAIHALLAAGKNAEAIRSFMAGAGVPDEMIEGMVNDPETVKMAPTMLYDIEVMGEIRNGGTIPKKTVRAIAQKALVLAGSESPSFFHDAAKAVATLLPDGTLQVLKDADHGAPAEKVAPAIVAFLQERREG